MRQHNGGGGEGHDLAKMVREGLPDQGAIVFFRMSRLIRKGKNVQSVQRPCGGREHGGYST